MIILFLGDVDEYLAKIALEFDINAQLVTKDNYQILKPGVYYTSLGDINDLKIFGMLLQQADKIIYKPPTSGVWSSGDDIRRWTEDYLNIFRFRCAVENYTFPVQNNSSMLELSDTRQVNSKQLWIAGCSISHGEGVLANQRYGTILSKKLNLPVSFLTHRGSSICWAADQILRSDIRRNDIIVWGLTDQYRLPFFSNGKLTHINGFTYAAYPELANSVSPNELSTENTLYRHITSVMQVLNFCNKIDATLIPVILLGNEFCSTLKNATDFVMLYNIWGRNKVDIHIDQGSDNQHPGPLTHQFFAEEIYQHIKCLPNLSLA